MKLIKHILIEFYEKKFILLAFFLGSYILNANEINEKLLNKFAENSVNQGSEFLFSIPPVFEELSSDNYITIYIIAAEETEVTVEVPSQYFNKKKAQKNEMLVFEIDASFGQVLSWNLSNNKTSMPANIYRNKAIRINSQKPVLCYVICQYRWTSDGFAAFPITFLQNSYIVSSYSDMGSYYNQYFPSEVTITAVEDNTDVKFVLGGNAATVVKYQDSIYYSGDTLKARLNKGDVWLIMSDGDLSGYPDLSGSNIKSNNPVAVNSGNVCANIPVKNITCDYIVTMDLPTNLWGKEYLVPPIDSRKYSQIIRIYAKEDSTIVYKDGIPFDTLYAKGLENHGWVETRMNGMGSPQSSAITGNKPINVSFYFPGSREDSITLGDPFTMSILPTEMFQNSVMFCTPRSSEFSSFDWNYINIVCPIDSIICLDTNKFRFTHFENGNAKNISLGNELKIISQGSFYSDVKSNDIKFAYFTIQLPHNGEYSIHSTEKFACYAFGFAQFASYGFSAFSLKTFNSFVDDIPPVAIAEVACDGSVIDGVIKDLPESAAIRSNLHSISLLQDDSENINFSFSPFVSGISEETSWKMNVVDIRYDANAAIQVVDKANNIDTLYYKYYGLKGITLTPVRNTLCLEKSMKDTLVFSLHNPKDTAMTLKLLIKQKYNTLKLKSDSLLTIHPRENKEIVFEVAFDSVSENKFLVLQKCNASDTIMLPLEYSITHYALDLEGKFDKEQYVIGDVAELTLKLANDTYPEELKKINEMTIKFDYNNAFASLDTSSIQFASLSDWKIVNKEIMQASPLGSHTSNFAVTIANTDGLSLNSSSEIFKARFMLSLPANQGEDFKLKDEYYQLTIIPTIATNYFPCAEIYNKNDMRVDIKKICEGDLRLINVSPYHFDMRINHDDITNITYSVAYDCNVQIRIFNLLGEEVAFPVSEDKIAGMYSFDTNQYLLPFGIYFCEMSAGTFHKTTCLPIFNP